MKTAIVYYSLEGNMDYLAKRIASDHAADLYKLIPKKEYPTGKISKFVWGGKSATFGEKPNLVNEKINLEKYDTLIIGSPIWAGTFAPPLHTFFHDYSISRKNIILVASHSGGGAEKCFTKMKEHLEGNAIKETFQFINPLLLQDESTDEKIKQIRQLIAAER
jgi:flavodoxin